VRLKVVAAVSPGQPQMVPRSLLFSAPECSQFRVYLWRENRIL